MSEVQEQRQEAVRTGPVALRRRVAPVRCYLLASAVIVSLCAVGMAIQGQRGELRWVTALFVCMVLLGLGAQPWVHRHASDHERVVLQMVEGNESVVLVSLAAVLWLGWGEIPPILAGVLGAAPPLLGLWGLRALRKEAV